MENSRTMSTLDRTMDAARIDPLKENPIISLVGSIRAMESDADRDENLPNGGAVRRAGRERTAALVASGLYDIRPARRTA